MDKNNKIDYTKLPKHVAIVMDGNGRWAQSRSLPRLAGHNAGMKTLKTIVKAASKIGLEHLTVYAFSTENWKRPEDEISGIFKILIYYVEKELNELHANNVRVNIIGDYKKLPEEAVKKLETSLSTTKNNSGLQLNIALNYGSRAEILKAVKSLISKNKPGETDVESLDEEAFSNYLYTADIPDPDLLIRTGGELRLSNFLLWQAAYSELFFTDLYWPDFKKKDLEEAILDYQNRKRRFGAVK